MVIFSCFCMSIRHDDHTYRTDATKDEKRVIRRKASNIVLRDGLLYLKHEGAERQWIVNKDSQMNVIVSCRDQALGKSVSLNAF